MIDWRDYAMSAPIGRWLMILTISPATALPVKDARPADEILGYDANGTPG